MDELGFIYLSDNTRERLIDHLSNDHRKNFDICDMDDETITNILKLIASTPDYQRA